MKPTLRPPDPDDQLVRAALPAGAIAGDSPLRTLWVALSQRWLDRQIAQAADPARSPALAVRARQLTARKVRKRVGDSIDRVLRAADAPSRRSSRVRPDRAAICAARAQLERISEILHSEDLVYARGVALSWALLRDAESPLFSAAEAGAAWYWAQLATQALEGHI